MEGSRWEYRRSRGKNTFEARLIVGWNAHTNRLYFAAEVYDNKHIIHHTAEHPDWIDLDDSFLVMLDADDSAGVYWGWTEEGTLDKDRHYAQATTYVMSVSGPSTPHIMSYNAGDWVIQPPWVEVGGDTPGEINTLEDTETVTFYEMSVVPFDFLSWRGPEQSTMHTLKGGEIIGLSVAFHNFYRHIESDSRKRIFFDSFHSEFSTGAPMPSGNAKYFSDFLLVPAEEEDVSQVSSCSWEWIKSTFLTR